jgi:molybdopterin-binding protein
VGVETIQPGFVVAVNNGLATVQAGSAELTAISADITSGPVHVCIRGEEVTLERGRIPQTSARNQLAARVVSLYPEGATVRVVVDCGFILTALVTRPAVEQLALAVGDPIIALIKAPAIHLLRR